MNERRIVFVVALAVLLAVFVTRLVRRLRGSGMGTQAGVSTVLDTKAGHMGERQTERQHTNRLAAETSPYLLQHANNPVDWYPWGAEAFGRARQQDKPIFLSIGYSTCHWCHVMERESFEDDATAELLNAHFVAIKVDREQRPDVDDTYMKAVQMMTGSGGWPLSVFLTPDGKPFYGGTYFPPTSRYGRPGFKDLLRGIAEAWTERRGELLASSEKVTELLRERADGAPGQTLSPDVLDEAFETLSSHFDETYGGFGGAPKFPQPTTLMALLHTWHRTRRPRALEMVEATLDAMARGGIHDHLAGGFHRYSTDARWLVPHFEKMLYDQALVSRIYLDAYQLTGKPLYARAAREIFDYVIEDLQSPGGGFYSTRDADSEGEEGKFYVWTKDEIVAALGERDGELFCAYYNVIDGGNWQDSHSPGVVKNILHVTDDLETVARDKGVEPNELGERLAAGRTKLRELRDKRVPPGLDDKILVEWNGMMIASLARGGAVLGEEKYTAAATRAAEFVLKNQYRDGHLLRAWRDGRTLGTAFLTDYAWMIEALIELYEATFERRWLDRAMELNGVVTERFWDDAGGGFFFTADDHETLIARSKDVRDAATPSGNSVQLMNLLRLAVITGDEQPRKMAERTISHFAGHVVNAPGTSERFLAAVEFALAGPLELVVVGDPTDERTRELLRTIRTTYMPNRVIVLVNPAEADANLTLPLTKGRELVSGGPAVYVCRDYTCAQPVTTPAELRGLLGEGASQGESDEATKK